MSFFEDLWQRRYAGIFRANMAIQTMDNVTGWVTAGKREQLLGEAHFLRAYFYLDLVQAFGQVPLVLETDPQNLPKSPADEIYAQIASDLKEAIALFPATPFPNYGAGHASKWAAEALMARVYLFYTGFYNKSSLPWPAADPSPNKRSSPGSKTASKTAAMPWSATSATSGPIPTPIPPPTTSMPKRTTWSGKATAVRRPSSPLNSPIPVPKVTLTALWNSSE